MAVRARTHGEEKSIWPPQMHLAKKHTNGPVKLTATQKRRALKKKPTDNKPSYANCGGSDPAGAIGDRINVLKPTR